MNHSYFLESDMSLMEAPERNLAFDLVRVTEAAALASARWLGRGDKNAGDGAAVDALEQAFVGQIGDVAADRHGRDTEFLRKRGDAHRTARTQAAQDQMLTL